MLPVINCLIVKGIFILLECLEMLVNGFKRTRMSVFLDSIMDIDKAEVEGAFHDGKGVSLIVAENTGDDTGIDCPIGNVAKHRRIIVNLDKNRF